MPRPKNSKFGEPTYEYQMKRHLVDRHLTDVERYLDQHDLAKLEYENREYKQGHWEQLSTSGS